MKVYTTSANARLLEHVPSGAKTALDLGCASGGMAAELKNHGISTDGVTFNADEKLASEKHCSAVWVYNLEEGLPDATSGPYDIVILSHVMEHIVNPDKLLLDVFEVLADDGVILCAIPNMLFLYNRLKLLCGKIEYTDYGLMDYTHVRWYTKISLIEKFKQHRFEANHFYAEGNAPLGPLRRVFPVSLCAKIDRLLIAIAPSWFAWEYSFTFNKR